MPDVELNKAAFLWFINALYPYLSGREQEKQFVELRGQFEALPESIPAYQHLKLFLELNALCLLILTRSLPVSPTLH